LARLGVGASKPNVEAAEAYAMGSASGTLTARAGDLARRAFVPLIYGVASGFTLLAFLAHWGAALALELDTVLRFATPRPYVYRVLSPLIVRAIVASLPAHLGPALVAQWAHGVPALLAFEWRSRAQPTVPFLASTWLMFASLWGAALVWRALVRWALPERPRALADAIPLIGLLLLPATFVGGGFLYDLPELFLVSACFLAFVRSNWTAYYPLLIASILNREGSFILVSWWFAQGRMLRDASSKRVFWTHATLSAGIGAVTVLALWWTFRASPGNVAQPNFAHNVAYWASLRWLVASHDEFAMGIPLPVGPHLVNVAVMALVWRFGRRRVPSVVAPAFLSSVAAVAPLALLFGFENEVRVFSVAVPAFVVLGAGAVDALYDSPPRTHSPSSP
jgi:hypothetical protein